MTSFVKFITVFSTEHFVLPPLIPSMCKERTVTRKLTQTDGTFFQLKSKITFHVLLLSIDLGERIARDIPHPLVRR